MLKNNLDYIMWSRKIEATQLAQKAGLSRQIISQIRNNPRHGLTSTTIEKLCNALEITPSELLMWETEGSQTPVAA